MLRFIRFTFLLSFLSASLFSQVSISVSHTLCSGEAAFATANTASITMNSYTWTTNPSASLIATPGASATSILFPSAGIYTITLSSNSGSTVYYAYQTVTVYPSPQLVLSSSNPSLCFGQDATLTVSGAPNYVWDTLPGMYFLNGFTAQISPGITSTYSVIGTNTFGCKSMTSLIQYVFAYPSLVLSPSPASVCPGLSSTITANGASSYTWSGTGIGSVVQSSLVTGSGTYSVIASNGNVCFDTALVTVGLALPLSLTVTASRTILCLNPDLPEPAVSLNVGGATTYVWAPYAPAQMTYSLGPQTYVTPTVSTCYTLTGSTSLCSGTAILCISVSECTGLESHSEPDFLSVFPNPVQGELFVSCSSPDITKIEIKDVFGKTLLTQNVDFSENSKQRILLTEIPAGVYFVQVKSKDHNTHTKRILKN